MKRTKLGLLFKFGISLSIVIAATSALLGTFQIVHERSRVIGDLKDKGYSLSKNLAYIAELGINTGDRKALDALLNNLLEDKDLIYGQIFDVKGDLLASKEKNDKSKGAMFNISVPVESSDGLVSPKEKSRKVKVIGVVKAGISLEKADRIAGSVIQFSIGTVSAVILLGILAVFLIIKYLLIEPLNQLIIGTQEIAKGAFSHRIQVESSDEIGALADSFNAMTVQLEKDNVKLSDYAKNLEQLVFERTGELQAAKKSLEAKVRERTDELAKEKASLEEKVTQRTGELQKKVNELKDFYDLAVGRELKMIELENKIKALERDQ